MIKINDKPILYVDCDDTLVMFDGEYIPSDELDDYLEIEDVLIWPHQKHINLLKTFSARGHTIVVWSAGGSDWAEKVVEILDLKRYVDIVMPKPSWFIDDMPSSHFMNESDRIWLDPRVKNPSKIKPRTNDPINGDK